LGLDSQQELGVFLFSNASRPALGPKQRPIQWIHGDLSLGLKRPGHEIDHSSTAKVKECVVLHFRCQYVFMAWCLLKAQGQLLPFTVIMNIQIHA
jgi:hypothetical protein